MKSQRKLSDFYQAEVEEFNEHNITDIAKEINKIFAECYRNGTIRVTNFVSPYVGCRSKPLKFEALNPLQNQVLGFWHKNPLPYNQHFNNLLNSVFRSVPNIQVQVELNTSNHNTNPYSDGNYGVKIRSTDNYKSLSKQLKNGKFRTTVLEMARKDSISHARRAKSLFDDFYKITPPANERGNNQENNNSYGF